MRAKRSKTRILLLFHLALVASPVMSEPVAAPNLQALSTLEAGQWQLREKMAGEMRSICVNDPKILLQIRHSKAVCSRFVISNDPKLATVHYTCPGAGHGRTSIRVETPRLAQIESQGIAEKEPFSVMYEARRIGACGVSTSMVRR